MKLVQRGTAVTVRERLLQLETCDGEDYLGLCVGSNDVNNINRSYITKTEEENYRLEAVGGRGDANHQDSQSKRNNLPPITSLRYRNILHYVHMTFYNDLQCQTKILLGIPLILHLQFSNLFQKMCSCMANSSVSD